MSLHSDLSFVKRGKNRFKVFAALEGAMMPSELVRKLYGKSSNTHFNIVSRALTELCTKKLVRVVNPEDKTGRLYELTKKGQAIKTELHKTRDSS